MNVKPSYIEGDLDSRYPQATYESSGSELYEFDQQLNPSNPQDQLIMQLTSVPNSTLQTIIQTIHQDFPEFKDLIIHQFVRALTAAIGRTGQDPSAVLQDPRSIRISSILFSMYLLDRTKFEDLVRSIFTGRSPGV